MFSNKNDVDPKVVQQPIYRTINPDCAGVDLSNAKLKSKDARKVLTCLNSNQSVDPLVQLVNRISDEELDALLDVGNRQFIDRPQRLHEVDVTWGQLKTVGVQKELIASLGKSMRHPELTLAVGQALAHLQAADGRTLDPFLVALSKKLDRDSMRTLVSWMLDAGGSKAFESFQKDLLSDSVTGISIDEAATQASTFARATALRDDGSQDRDPLRELFKNVRTGALFPALDRLNGTTPDQMRVGVARYGGLLHTLAADQSKGLRAFQKVMHGMQGPVPCMKASYTIPDFRQFGLGELYRVKATEIRTYLARGKPNEIVFGDALCDLPPEFLKAVWEAEPFVDGPIVDEAHELLLTFHDTGLEPLIISVTDPDLNSINRMIPLFSEVTARGIFDDVLLFISMAAPGEGRERLKASLGLWLDPAADGKSLQDQFITLLARLDPSEIAGIIRAAQPVLKEPESVATSLLSSIRTTFEINASEPLLSLARDELANDDFRHKTLPILLKLSKMPEADAAIRWASKMGESGELVPLVDTILSLFHRYAEDHAQTVEIPALTVAPFVSGRAHNLARSDLMDWKIAIRQGAGDADLADASLDPYAACRAVDLTMNLTDTSNPGFNAQMKNMARCFRTGAADDMAGPAVDFFADTKVSDGQTSLIQFLMDGIKKIDLSAVEIKAWVDRLNQANTRGEVPRLIQSIPLLVHGADGQSSLTRPLLDLWSPIVQNAFVQWQRLESLGADLIRREDLAPIVSLVRTLDDRDSPLPPPKVSIWEDLATKNRVRELVQNRECYSDPIGINARTKQIVSDFEYGVTGFEQIGGRARTQYSNEDMKAELQPTIQKLADPSSGAPTKSVIRALLNVMHYFTLKPGEPFQLGRHYLPEELGRWLHDRSEDYQPLLYFFPGDAQPRVRLVNSLDRLELVLYNAYFTYVLPDNNGQKFLQMIAESWGDEPRSSWPAEIQAQYPPGSRPATLHETYDKMAGTLGTFGTLIGYPKVPDCTPHGVPGDGLHIPQGLITVPGWMAPGLDDVKNRLFNMQMVLPVIAENLPDAHGPHAGGMRVLRDLFYELVSSTPAQYRNARSGERNNLSIIYHLIRVGLMRNSGRLLRHPDPSFEAFFRGFVTAADAPGVEPLLKYLTQEDPGQELLWKAIDSSWKITPQGPEATYRAQQSLFYFFTLVGQSRFNVIPQVIGGLTEAIRSNRDFIIRNLDSVMLDGLASADLGNALQNLYTSDDEFGKNALGSLLSAAVADPIRVPDLARIARVIDDDPQSKDSLKKVKDRWKTLKTTPEWTSLHASEILDFAVDFLTEEANDDGRPRPSLKARKWIADRLLIPPGKSNTDLDELVIAISKDPNGFHKAFEALAQSSLPVDPTDPRSSAIQSLVDRGNRAFK